MDRTIDRVVIWGTGQGGRMMLNLLSADMNVVAFCDNNKTLHGTVIDGIPVVDEQELVKINPDRVYIAILNGDACFEVKTQIEKLGIPARICPVTELRQQFDIRLAVLRLIAKEIEIRRIPGAVAELGVYRGEFAAELNRLFPERRLYLFDTFEGFDERDLRIERENHYSRPDQGKFQHTSMEAVHRMLPYPDRAIFRKGYFPETACGVEDTFALVSLDADLYQPMYEGLKFFLPENDQGRICPSA